jgi:ubiquinone/menaquinone biosynthesis C-methylase UbiE
MFNTGLLARYPRLARRVNTIAKNVYRWRYGWHREAIGGEWDLMGPAQLEFMKSVGLEPHHRLLDVGCGSLRGGVCFIPYLDVGNYYGIDKEPSLIDAAREKEIPRYKLQDKKPNLYVVDDFDVSRIGVEFDFMFSHSVFSHLSPEQIERCLNNLLSWLKPGGALYIDYKEGKEVRLNEPHKWRRDELSKAWYPRSFFEELAARKNYNMIYIGDWPNHTNDKMLKFTKIDKAVKAST